ncbi:hypothetical protein INT43_007883 [Umbelopsis isabellina]|uniref:BHLH domain-containing protein n=1 Tax=Mortierella isabellina TaxID=91625 RepID=A0A8H7PQ45_MORIS|nr:hypothetical protein INT43_007883 [Umbelopsis isabellina]
MTTQCCESIDSTTPLTKRNADSTNHESESRSSPDCKDEIGDLGGMFINFSSDMSDGGFKGRRKYKRAYKVNGVNILNRSEIDSKTMIERLKRRKENHNHIERKRRDHINNTIYELAEVLPDANPNDCKLNKGNILKATLQHIKDLQAENLTFRLQLQNIQSRASTPNATAHHKGIENNNMLEHWEPRVFHRAEEPIEKLGIRSAPSTPRGMSGASDYAPSFFPPQPVLPLPSSSNGALRPILPKSQFSPNMRMAGLEKQYSGACRY